MAREFVKAKIIEYVAEYNSATGFCPTFREVGHAVGLASTSDVHMILRQLREAGLVAFEDGMPRTIRVTPRA